MANIKSFHPGVYIQDALESMNMTAREFSLRTGISTRTLSPIINGKADITFEVALKLALYFDSSVDVWMNLQNQYNIYKLENKINEELEQDWLLIKGFKKYLIENNYISSYDSKEEIVFKCRKLVGVNNLTLLNKKDSFVCLKEQHNKTINDCFSQNFFIALALNESRKKEVCSFDKKKLQESLIEIKKLITKEKEVFMPKLESIFSTCGVSFVSLPYLTKSNIFGATKWLSKDKVMLAISNKSGKADLFWFTLFHEISHVLMEHKREMLINIKDNVDLEADSLAKNLLIDKKEWDSFITQGDYSEKSIIKFSKKIDILPCIVLGRLHKENIIPYGIYDKDLSTYYNFN